VSEDDATNKHSLERDDDFGYGFQCCDCDVPLPLLDAAALFFAAFVVVFDDFDAFAMVDCGQCSKQ